MLTIRTTGLQDYLEGGTGKVKVLVAGPPGSGKTRWASFAPKPIYAATEDGLMSVADRNVPYAHIQTEQDMDAFLTLLELEAKKPAAQRRWETVVVDTLDAYERLVIHHYLRKRNRDEMDGWEDWGYLSTRMTGLIGRLMLLPMNVVILLHVKETRVKGSDPTLSPRLKGDIRDQLPADFDFVGLLETEFGLVDGKRGVIRSISWESQPHAAWLKCRGGGLTRTPVLFEDSDFQVIFDGLRAQLEGITEAQDIQTIETAPEDAEVTPPSKGGPVGTTRAAKKAAAPRDAKVASPIRAVAAAPQVVTPPAATRRPLPTTFVPAEEGIANVEEILGGTPVEPNGDVSRETSAPVSPVSPVSPIPGTADTAPADLAEEQGALTPVVAPGVDDEPIEVDDESDVSRETSIPEDGNVTVACGQARYPGVPASNAGCGKPLQVVLEAGRVVGAPQQRPELVEIAGIRERAFLHNECYAALRASRAR